MAEQVDLAVFEQINKLTDLEVHDLWCKTPECMTGDVDKDTVSFSAKFQAISKFLKRNMEDEILQRNETNMNSNNEADNHTNVDDISNSIRQVQLSAPAQDSTTISVSSSKGKRKTLN